MAVNIRVRSVNFSFRRKHLVSGSVILVLLVLSSLWLANISPYRTDANEQYFRAKVLSTHISRSPTFGMTETIEAQVVDGPHASNTTTVTRTVNYGDKSYVRMPVGSDILLGKEKGTANIYQYIERWHIPGVATIFTILLIVVLLVGWWRGLTSLLGLTISIWVLAVFVIPRIIAGSSPYAVCIEAAFVITMISIYTAHGLSKRTTIALISSCITLGVVIGLVALSTYLVGTSEVVNEDATGLVSGANSISLSGLFTGAIIIASLGVLYDITTSQSAAVDEIRKANRKLSNLELYHKGLSVGREHIAALINTLALAYVGVALPSILITVMYNNGAPFVVALNGEPVVEEIIRTFVACMGTLLAVPITTALAAYLLPRWSPHKQKLLKN